MRARTERERRRDSPSVRAHGQQLRTRARVTVRTNLDRFVGEQVSSGAYSTASDVIRAALEHMAEQKRKEAWVLAALDAGIASGRAEPGTWDRVQAKIESRVQAARKRTAAR